jgi:hypothetical protein
VWIFLGLFLISPAGWVVWSQNVGIGFHFEPPASIFALFGTVLPALLATALIALIFWSLSRRSRRPL